MAWETGDALNSVDFFDKLHGFLTGSEALLSENAEWESLRYTPNVEFALRGKGLAGLDNIHVNMLLFQSPSTDTYNMLSSCSTSYLPGSAYNTQPGASHRIALPLNNNIIKYWFVANARRFIVIARVGTSYYSGYYGFGIPIGTPSQYPYPMLNGGAFSDERIGSSANLYATTWKHSTDIIYIRGVHKPGNLSIGSTFSTDRLSNVLCYDPSGNWLAVSDMHGGGVMEENGEYPRTSNSYDPYTRENFDGSYTLSPITIFRRTASNEKNHYMQYDGVYNVSGFGLGSESIITIAGQDYLTIQDVSRTGIQDFCAVRLN